MKKTKLYVVEGVHDEAHLKQIFKDIQTIAVGGSAVNKDVMNFLIENQEIIDIYLLFDPDYPGEKIRRVVASQLSKFHHIFIDQARARYKRKTGIEHVPKEVLLEALGHEYVYVKQETLPYHSFIELGLTGHKDSKTKREKIAQALHLGNPNAKTLFKRLNMIGITMQQLKEVIDGTSI